jgi:expansin
MYFSTTIAATAVIAIAKGAALISRANSGEATFYGGNTEGGTCSFKGYTIPSDLYGLALTDSSWDNSRACGGCIEVTGPKGNKITAMVCRSSSQIPFLF